ncbi:hypothetical protein CK203_003909 [Vitis vinifera]|uniref:Uncharacterized protein n=1 Tax=Vitis vinifera TaxID=29760 RepID=A0A438K917_VITVI|nr:hypothetical protein CK203_003909 [Vitis vinifera]
MNHRRAHCTTFFIFQVDCLKVDGVLQKRNLVYCASTSYARTVFIKGNGFLCCIRTSQDVAATRQPSPLSSTISVKGCTHSHQVAPTHVTLISIIIHIFGGHHH